MALEQARRTALAAQGLAAPRPAGPAGTRRLRAAFERLHLLQIDSVNVLARAHYLPLYSRLGPYDRAALDGLASRAPRRMVEYWAHEACFVRPELFDDLRVWQRRRWVGGGDAERLLGEDGPARGILDLLERSRPLTARQVQERLGHEPAADRSDWGWNWSATKRTLEVLFERGLVGVAGRTAQFERRYAPVRRVLPGGAPGEPPPPEEALDRLVAAAAAALGVGTVSSLAEYFRLPVRDTARSAERLVAAGTLEPVDVDGLGAHLLHRAAARPRAAAATALLGPFDPLVFDRPRLERLFGFRYRLEIYTPAERRTHGYYVLPFLLRGRFAARVDLKADRAAARLLVRAAHAEPGAPDDAAAALAGELRLLAGWLGLGDVALEAGARAAGDGFAGRLAAAV